MHLHRPANHPDRQAAWAADASEGRWPQRHRESVTLVISLLAAASIVGGAIWLLAADRRPSTTATSVRTDDRVLPTGATAGRMPAPAGAGAETSAPDLPAGAAALPAGPEAYTVTKCLVDGKTHYTDQPACAGQRVQVPIDPQANLMQADREVRARMAAARGAPSPAPATASIAAPAAAIRHYDGTACTALQSQIEAIDALARQPQGAPMQDRLRADRAAVRSRQIDQGC